MRRPTASWIERAEWVLEYYPLHALSRRPELVRGKRDKIPPLESGFPRAVPISRR